MKIHNSQWFSMWLVLLLCAFSGAACKPWKPPTPCTTTTTAKPATTTVPATTTTPATTTIPETTTSSISSTTTTLTEAELATVEWGTSGHADNSSEAFRDWDNATNSLAVVRKDCASCHSTMGFYEYLQTDNRTIKNSPLALNNHGITCDACHSSRAADKTYVKFASAATPTGSGGSGQTVNYPGISSVICGQCHQGRAWQGTVGAKILASFKSSTSADNATIQDKIPTTAISSTNPHYRAAFAAIKASKSRIAYEYGDTSINIDSTHPGGTDCMVCHNQHALEVTIGANGVNCQPCHAFTSLDDVLTFPQKANIDVKAAELYSLIKMYAADNTTKDVNGNAKQKYCIALNNDANPYWFNDTNCDGIPEDIVNKSGNYSKFTPRLAKACYNLLIYYKDPGLFAHNSKYALAFLDASINDIKKYKDYPVTDAEQATAEWEQSGHADYNSLAFRDWDNDTPPIVRASCASCHSEVGFNEFLITDNRTIANPPLANNNLGLACYTCHSLEAAAKTYVKFSSAATPTGSGGSGQTVNYPGISSVICGQCHQGRAWQGTVETNIKKGYPKGDNATTIDKISSKITSTNPHYRAAFAALKASKSRIGYDYGDLAIAVDSTHPGGTDCMVCHNQHSTEVKFGSNCQSCHTFTSVADIALKMNKFIPDLEAELLLTIQNYAADNTTLDAAGKTKAKACIALDNNANPYWFADANCDGVPDNATSSGSYKSFTPRLARACYNLLVSLKDPGGYAHNEAYIRTLLQKSIDNLRLY